MRHRPGRVLHSARFLGIAYLALIPIFASVYSALGAGNFHDSNVEHEQALTSDAAHLIGSLSAEVPKRIVRLTWTSTSGPLRLRQSTVHVDRVRRTAERLLLIEAVGEFVQPPHAFGNFAEWVDVRIDNRVVIEEPGSPPLYGFLVERSDASGNPIQVPFFTPPISMLFPWGGGGASASTDGGELLLHRQQYRQLVRFYDAAGGDPSYASELWLRMLYFSATSITTLGFGDITPVSTTARMWVAGQAIAGVVLIGLFLNAIAGRMARRHEPEAP